MYFQKDYQNTESVVSAVFGCVLWRNESTKMIFWLAILSRCLDEKLIEQGYLDRVFQVVRRPFRVYLKTTPYAIERTQNAIWALSLSWKSLFGFVLNWFGLMNISLGIERISYTNIAILCAQGYKSPKKPLWLSKPFVKWVQVTYK